MPLLFGRTSAGLMVPVRVDDNGLLANQSLGWFSSAWQKNPLELGYSAAIRETVSNLNAAAGANTLTSTAVPAGEIWVITQVAAMDLNNPPTTILLALSSGGNAYTILDQAGPGAGRWSVFNGIMVVAPGETIIAIISGCVLNDDIYLRYQGRRIDTDQ